MGFAVGAPYRGFVVGRAKVETEGFEDRPRRLHDVPRKTPVRRRGRTPAGAQSHAAPRSDTGAYNLIRGESESSSFLCGTVLRNVSSPRGGGLVGSRGCQRGAWPASTPPQLKRRQVGWTRRSGAFRCPWGLSSRGEPIRRGCRHQARGYLLLTGRSTPIRATIWPWLLYSGAKPEICQPKSSSFQMSLA